MQSGHTEMLRKMQEMQERVPEMHGKVQEVREQVQEMPGRVQEMRGKGFPTRFGQLPEDFRVYPFHFSRPLNQKK